MYKATKYISIWWNGNLRVTLHSIVCKHFFYIFVCHSKTTGKCKCKQNVDTARCDKCKPGYFNFSRNNPSGCNKCDCNPLATIPVSTDLTLCDDKTGQCKCKTNFVQGQKCDYCIESMYNLEFGCSAQCICDPFGSLNPVCDQKSGQCVCKPNIGGLKCNICLSGYYNLTINGCTSKCGCSSIGSTNSSYCNSTTGQCNCKLGYTGRSCDTCSNGYWRPNSISECAKCSCNLKGVLDTKNICDQVRLKYLQMSLYSFMGGTLKHKLLRL